jgi:hypothetical protein
MSTLTPEAYRLRELDEVLGIMHDVEVAEGNCLALIGTIPVILPGSLENNLKGLQGRKIGILLLDGYHLREVA